MQSEKVSEQIGSCCGNPAAAKQADETLIYTVEISTNPVDGVWTNNGYTVTGICVTGKTLDFVTNEVDTAEDERFIRLKIGK